MSIGTLQQTWNWHDAADQWISRLVVALTTVGIVATVVWSVTQISAALSQPLYPVAGRLLVAGYPQGEAEVLAHRRGSHGWETLSVGVTDRDGRFQLRMYDIGSGLPAGEYVATVRWRPLAVHGESLVPGPDVIDRRYSRPETSPLRIHTAAPPAAWDVPLGDELP